MVAGSEVDRRTHLRQLAALHRLPKLAEGQAHAERVLAPVGRHGDVRGDHREQRGLRRQDHPDPLERATDRLRHRRPDEQLAADGAREERLARPARSLAARKLRHVCEPARQEPGLRPRQQVHGRLAVRVHGHRLRPEQDQAQDHEHPRPVGSRLQGPGRHDDRPERLRERRPALRRRRRHATPPRTTGIRRGRRSRRRRTRASSGATTTSTTSMRSRAARSGSRRPGRATSSRPGPAATRTSSSWCRRRASCTGRTT